MIASRWECGLAIRWERGRWEDLRRMRIKIIAVNALIVAIVGLLSFLLVRSSLGSGDQQQGPTSTDAQEEVNGAAARLQLDGLRTERWYCWGLD